MVGWRMMVIVEGVVDDVDEMGIYPGITPDISRSVT